MWEELQEAETGQGEAVTRSDDEEESESEPTEVEGYCYLMSLHNREKNVTLCTNIL